MFSSLLKPPYLVKNPMGRARGGTPCLGARSTTFLAGHFEYELN
jgi:hypothetical protein